MDEPTDIAHSVCQEKDIQLLFETVNGLGVRLEEMEETFKEIKVAADKLTLLTEAHAELQKQHEASKVQDNMTRDLLDTADAVTRAHMMARGVTMPPEGTMSDQEIPNQKGNL